VKAPRVPERVVQRQIVQALRAVGAKVYIIGTVHAGEPGRMTTRMTPGIPDLFTFLPMRDGVGPRALWIEVKSTGGRLRPEQAEFRDLCHGAGGAHIVGGLDDVLAYLQQWGYVREAAHYRKAGAA
jgi:hypothetical protein